MSEEQTFDPGTGWRQVGTNDGVGRDRIIRVDADDIRRAVWVRVDPLPTEPGYYLDADGEGWRLYSSGNWYPWNGRKVGPETPTRLPLRRLVVES